MHIIFGKVSDNMLVEKMFSKVDRFKLIHLGPFDKWRLRGAESKEAVCLHSSSHKVKAKSQVAINQIEQRVQGRLTIIISIPVSSGYGFSSSCYCNLTGKVIGKGLKSNQSWSNKLSLSLHWRRNGRNTSCSSKGKKKCTWKGLYG